MQMPIGTDRSRLSPTIERAVVRDHGPAPRITMALIDASTGSYREFQIDGLVWKYSTSGRLIDAYRWTVGHRGGGRRTEIETSRLHVPPPILAYVETTADAFFDLALRTAADVYEGCRAGATTCYRVHDGGREVGMVVRVRFLPEEVTYQPTRQWLAIDGNGDVWEGYGRTRNEAARHLLEEDDATAMQLLAA